MRYLITILLLLAACSRGETTETEPQPAEVETPTQTAAPESAKSAELDGAASILDAPPSVELLDPGKAPRKELRRHFERGSKHAIRLQSAWNLDIAVFPMETKRTMPNLDYDLEATTTTVAEDGATHFELHVADVVVVAVPGKAVDLDMVDVTEKAASALKGLHGRFSIEPHGLVQAFEMLDVSTSTARQTSVRMQEMIEQIGRALQLASLPLPEEPVGNGAKWVATQVIKHRGARIQQKSTYELLEVKGSRVRVKVTYEQIAPKQMFRPPGASSDLELNQLQFEGNGEGTWQLEALAPRSASETTTSLLVTTKLAPQIQFVVVGDQSTLKVGEGR